MYSPKYNSYYKRIHEQKEKARYNAYIRSARYLKYNRYTPTKRYYLYRYVKPKKTTYVSRYTPPTRRYTSYKRYNVVVRANRTSNNYVYKPPKPSTNVGLIIVIVLPVVSLIAACVVYATCC